jgi:thioredoxin-like negative regulator of GroEL
LAKSTTSKKERFENIMRPNRHLGYDYFKVGIHICNKGAYKIAEVLFKRAVWLNPFEPKFKIHLARCLYHLNLLEEAHKWIIEALNQDLEDKDAQIVLKWINESIKSNNKLGETK